MADSKKKADEAKAKESKEKEKDEQSLLQTKPLASFEHVQVHPVVLLSVVDHYNRVAKDTKKRVVGCLLGYKQRGTMHVSNCFAVPFDEEERPPQTWFLDSNYLEDMFGMFRRVNAKEKIIGWYSTGPKLKRNDIDIHRMFFRWTKEPLLVVIQVTQDTEEVPTKAYVSRDVARQDGRHDLEFAHVPTLIQASEVEEIGVEHLLRDIQDNAVSTLTTEINHKLTSLRGLASRLQQIKEYLDDVCAEKLPINQQILQNIQLIFNLVPNLTDQELVKSFAVKNNDQGLSIYIAALVRAILALDHLIENKANNKRKEREKEERLKKEAEEEAAALAGEANKKKKLENLDDEKDGKSTKDEKSSKSDAESESR